MDYQQLESLRANHPAWRLLKADNAVLIASFLHRTFIAPNLRSCPESELISKVTIPRQSRGLYDWNRPGR